jgi:hypothetical protein
VQLERYTGISFRVVALVPIAPILIYVMIYEWKLAVKFYAFCGAFYVFAMAFSAIFRVTGFNLLVAILYEARIIIIIFFLAVIVISAGYAWRCCTSYAGTFDNFATAGHNVYGDLSYSLPIVFTMCIAQCFLFSVYIASLLKQTEDLHQAAGWLIHSNFNDFFAAERASATWGLAPATFVVIWFLQSRRQPVNLDTWAKLYNATTEDRALGIIPKDNKERSLVSRSGQADDEDAWQICHHEIGLRFLMDVVVNMIISTFILTTLPIFLMTSGGELEFLEDATAIYFICRIDDCRGPLLDVIFPRGLSQAAANAQPRNTETPEPATTSRPAAALLEGSSSSSSASVGNGDGTTRTPNPERVRKVGFAA